MTTATLAAGNRTMDTVDRPRRSLEELVDQLFAAMGFKDETETAEPSVTRSIHEARRLRQSGDVDGGPGGARRTWTWGRRSPGGSLGLLRVEAAGEAAVRRKRASWSTARARAGPPPWCPTATAGRWRSRRSWGCAGGPARSSRGAASGVCGP